MHKILVIIVAVLSLAACTATERGAAIGAGTGAIVGAATTGTVLGTAVGAGVGGVVGAAAGNVIGRVGDSQTQCYYRDSRGRTYIDACPRG